MQTVILVAFFFILGIVALRLLAVAKNVAYILFVVIIGGSVWYYISPKVLPEGQSTEEALVAINDSYVKEVTSDIEKLRDENKFADSITDDFDKVFQNAGKEKGVQSWSVEEDADHSSADSEGFLSRVIATIQRIFSEVFN